jgi:hypothetical protein
MIACLTCFEDANSLAIVEEKGSREDAEPQR